jgi:prophage antirepressor-like protein
MDIIKAFKNNEMTIHVTIQGTHEEPLFRASDIGTVLEMTNIRASIKDFDSTEKHGVNTIDIIGRNQETTFLTEKGLYKILFKSRKPIAEKFTNWVCDVIKEIRLNSIYEYQKQLSVYDTKLQLKDIQKEQNLLTNFHKKPIVYLGLTEDNIARPGITDDIERRLKEHKKQIRPDFTFEYVYETIYNEEVERRLYHHPEMKKRRAEKKEYNGKIQTEIFNIDKIFTISTIDKLIKEIIKEVEAYETDKDKNAEIDKLKLILIEKDKIIADLKDQFIIKENIENKTIKNDIIYIGHDTIFPNLFQIGSVVELNKNNKNFEYDFTTNTKNAYDIELLAKQLLKYFYYENNYYKIDLDHMKNTINFCIMAYDKFGINKSQEELSRFIATKYKSNIISTSQKAIISNKIYKTYIEQNIIYGKNLKVPDILICEDFQKWYTNKFPDNTKLFKLETGNWSKNFKDEITNAICELTKIKNTIINLNNSKRGLKFNNYTGFEGFELKNMPVDKITYFKDNVYKEYIDEYVILTNNLSNKISKMELIDDFLSWTKDNQYESNKPYIKTEILTTFKNTFIKKITEISGCKFDEKVTKSKEDGTSCRGCFIGIGHKKIKYLFKESYHKNDLTKLDIIKKSVSSWKDLTNNSQIAQIYRICVTDGSISKDTLFKLFKYRKLDLSVKERTNWHLLFELDNNSYKLKDIVTELNKT